jgi:hypothetical protein
MSTDLAYCSYCGYIVNASRIRPGGKCKYCPNLVDRVEALFNEAWEDEVFYHSRNVWCIAFILWKKGEISVRPDLFLIRNKGKDDDCKAREHGRNEFVKWAVSQQAAGIKMSATLKFPGEYLYKGYEEHFVLSHWNFNKPEIIRVDKEVQKPNFPSWSQICQKITRGKKHVH